MLIKHYFLCRKTVTETDEKCKNYYGDPAPAHGMAHKWFPKFRCGRTNITHSEHSECPIDIMTDEIMNKIHD